MTTTTFATEQELLDYCEAIEIEEALARTLELEFKAIQREFPAIEGEDYDYV